MTWKPTTKEEIEEIQRERKEIESISKLSRDSDEWFNLIDKYYRKTLPIVKAHAEAKMNKMVAWMKSDINSAV